MPVCFLSTTLTSIQLWKYGLLSMLSIYLSCDIHLTQKTFFSFIHIRVVPFTTLGITAKCNVFDDGNPNRFAKVGGLNPCLFRGLRDLGGLISFFTLCQLLWQSLRDYLLNTQILSSS